MNPWPRDRFAPSSAATGNRYIKTPTTALGYPTSFTPLTSAMAGTEELPAYTVTVDDPSPGPSLPPSYDNTNFTIGSRTVSRPLVSTEQLKSHLRLLGVFMLMKQKVENPDSDPRLTDKIPLIAKALPPEERWVWFLELAVERYILVLTVTVCVIDYLKLRQVWTLGCKFEHIWGRVHSPSH